MVSGGLAAETLPALVKLGNEFSAALKDPAVQSALTVQARPLTGVLNAVAANPQAVRAGVQAASTITIAAATIIAKTVTVTGAVITAGDKVTGALKSAGVGNPSQHGTKSLRIRSLRTRSRSSSRGTSPD